MPDVSVVVPWRPGCPHREAAWEWVYRRYQALGLHVVEGHCPDGDWCKAAAVADGVRRTDAEILVVADADVWTDAVTAAAAVVEAGAGWVVPRCEVRRLSEEATGVVLAGGTPSGALGLAQKAYPGVLAGGSVVLSRSSYEAAPMDRRFLGWGGEDQAWEIALRGLIGAPVVLGWQGWPLWHLWHPPQERISRAVGSQGGLALYRRYRTVRNHRHRLAELVDEGRVECLSSLSQT